MCVADLGKNVPFETWLYVSMDCGYRRHDRIVEKFSGMQVTSRPVVACLRHGWAIIARTSMSPLPRLTFYKKSRDYSCINSAIVKNFSIQALYPESVSLIFPNGVRISCLHAPAGKTTFRSIHRSVHSDHAGALFPLLVSVPSL